MPSEVLLLHCSDGADVIMICTENNAYSADVQKDRKGEFIILPDELLPKRKNRKAYLGKGASPDSEAQP